MKTNNKVLLHILKESFYVFERECSIKPGKWVAISDSTIITSGTELRCNVLTSYQGSYIFHWQYLLFIHFEIGSCAGVWR